MGAALAGLRHPAKVTARIANAATHAACTVSSPTEIPKMTDTQASKIPPPPPSLPTGAAEPTHVSGILRVLTVFLAVIGLGIPVVLAALALIPADKVATKLNERVDEVQGTPFARVPSVTRPVNDQLRFGDLDDVAEVYPASGSMFFVTVSEPRQSVLSWLVGRADPAVEFLTAEEHFGFQAPGVRRTFSVEMMRTSKQVAQYLALEVLGFDVQITPGEVLIWQMVCLEFNAEGTECLRETPSASVLEPGDRLLTADGVELNEVGDIAELLKDKRPGDVILVEIERPNQGRLSVEVELIASPNDEDRTIIGFIPFDTRRVVLPFELDIDTGSIGGPSAGLAFTLALIDELSPGELTGGRSIAVTGTVDLSGDVGPIGGLRQKAAAVAQAGVEIFLVPRAQSEEDLAAARIAGGPNLQIIEVSSLAEALEVLESLGGDPLGIAVDARS
jgi:PDZ domain-containing protein